MNPFPTDIIPEPLREFVFSSASALACDEIYVAVPLLPAVGSAIGNTRRIRLKHGWTEPPIIWAAAVGDSGTGKSAGFEAAMRPLWRLQRAILKEHAKLRADHQVDLQAWKDAKGKATDRPEPPAPCQHPICVDITIEALADRLLATPRGTLVAPEELGAWFGSFNAYKTRGADVSHWLALFGARALKVDRKGGDRTTTYIPYAAVGVTGTIQPATLGRALSAEFDENGITARLLLAMPEPRPKRWTETEVPEHITRAVDTLFDGLFALKMSPGIDGYDEPVLVDLSDSARGEWADFVNRHNEAMQELQGLDRALAAKLEGYAARFALIFHCVQLATGEKKSEYVEAADVVAGITLAEWFGVETRRVYRAMRETPEDRNRRQLLEWVASRGGRVTVRDVQRHLRRYQHDDEQAELDLSALVNKGYGAWQYVGSGQRGRPTHIFCLAESPDYPITKSADADKNSNNNGQHALTSARGVE